MVKIIDVGIGLEQSLDIPNHVELFEAQFAVVDFLSPCTPAVTQSGLSPYLREASLPESNSLFDGNKSI
jgi:hypothetical protein